MTPLRDLHPFVAAFSCAWRSSVAVASCAASVDLLFPRGATVRLISGETKDRRRHLRKFSVASPVQLLQSLAIDTFAFRTGRPSAAFQHGRSYHPPAFAPTDPFSGVVKLTSAAFGCRRGVAHDLGSDTRRAVMCASLEAGFGHPCSIGLS
jgi:hypothetical protein